MNFAAKSGGERGHSMTAAVRKGEQEPFFYCDPCHGIAPVRIGAPRDFLVAQAFVVALALVVLLLVV